MSHHQIEISSIQQLWASAKEQLNKLRESLYVSEQKNRELHEDAGLKKKNRTLPVGKVEFLLG